MRGWWGTGWRRIGEGFDLVGVFVDEAIWDGEQHSELRIDGVESRGEW